MFIYTLGMGIETLYDGMMRIFLLEVLPYDESSVNSLAN